MMTWQQFNKEHPLSPEDAAIQEIILKIVSTRREQKITQCQLAKKIGMSQSQLAKIETLDTTPKIDTLLRILYGLGLSFSITANSKTTN
ncbi:helix-turn-helix domain-containing protein [Enterococcus sp. LJL90]